LPCEYFNELAGMMTDSAIMLNMIEESLPNVINHLQKFNSEIFLKNLLYKWFISLFMENMNKKICYVIFDFFLFEGNLILFKATILIIFLIKEKILNINNFSDMNNFFEKEIKNFNHQNFAEFLMKNNFFKFDMNYINKKRKEIIIRTKEQILKTFELKKLRKNNNEEIQCDFDFPECLKKNSEPKINSFFIYKQINFPKIIEDFYDYRHNIKILNKNRIEIENNRLKKISEFNDKNVIQTEIFGNLLIERQKHFCNCNRSSREEILGELNEEKITNMKLFFEEKNKNSKKIQKNLNNQNFNLNNINKTVYNIDNKNKKNSIKKSFINLEE
jgi:hypothetical protein